MEWYFANNMEDLAVPKDEEMLDRLPSPDSWCSWGKVVGNFNPPKKLTVLGVEDYLLNDSDVVDQLSTPSSRQQSAYHHKNSDAQQLNDLSTIDDADDIFFRSIFEADSSSADRADSSASFRQTSSKDDRAMMMELSGERDHIHDPMDNLENFGHFLPSKKMQLETSITDEHFDMFEDIGEEDMSMEVSALLELQTLTAQLSKETRVCFRDSLYRLAENSRHHQKTKFGQNGKEDTEKCKATTSGGHYSARETQAKKLDTNAIDRTVATLLFNTMECCSATADTAPNLSAEMGKKGCQVNHFYLSGSSYDSSLCTAQESDAEVPTFGLTNQRLMLPTKAQARFSDTYAMTS